MLYYSLLHYIVRIGSGEQLCDISPALDTYKTDFLFK